MCFEWRIPFPDCVHVSGGNDKVVRFVQLQHLPHALYIVARVAPVTLRVEVAELKAVQMAEADFGHGTGNLRRRKKTFN
jgi:hypothetical protein